MELFRRLNKYVSSKSLFLHLTLFCLSIFNCINWGSRSKVNSINNLAQLFYICKTKNIGLAKKRRKDEVNS